jgi:hypothetical protein
LSVNFKLKSGKTGQTLLVGTDQDRRNLRLEIADPKGKKFAGFFAPRGRERGKKLLTPKDASITGISYQVGKGRVKKAPTLKIVADVNLAGNRGGKRIAP